MYKTIANNYSSNCAVTQRLVKLTRVQSVLAQSTTSSGTINEDQTLNYTQIDLPWIE